MPRLREQRIKERKARIFRRRMMILVVIVLIVASFWTIYYLGSQPRSESNSNQTASESNKVLLRTSMGDITIQLYDDMPITTGNFKTLVKTGVYDDTIFHRVVANFVIQGGDASAKGISVATIQDELPNKHSNVRGSVAMAKTSEPNSATSQFYINLNDTNAATLDSNYSVFGTVIAGMDVVDAIGQAETVINEETGEKSKPVQAITIITAEFAK